VACVSVCERSIFAANFLKTGFVISIVLSVTGLASMWNNWHDFLVLLVLLVAANGASIIVGKLLPDIGGCELDFGRNFFDGQPIFGVSKTVRGLVASIVLAALLASL